MRVLYVDDDELVRAAVTTALTPHCRVEVAPSGVEAADLWSRTAFDAVAVDLHLKGASGLDLLQVLRHESPSTWRVLVTGARVYDLPGGIADRVVRKPFTVRELLTSLVPARADSGA